VSIIAFSQQGELLFVPAVTTLPSPPAKPHLIGLPS
jgi:hypothetical protein